MYEESVALDPNASRQPGSCVRREHRNAESLKKGGRMEDPIVEMLAWLLVKPEEEILAEAEVAILRSLYIAEDPRPERAGSNS
jgi:hypothetical protein